MKKVFVQVFDIVLIYIKKKNWIKLLKNNNNNTSSYTFFLNNILKTDKLIKNSLVHFHQKHPHFDKIYKIFHQQYTDMVRRVNNVPNALHHFTKLKQIIEV